MRLRNFDVENFGALHRVSGTFAPRVSVVWGENKSGKTTLLNFIRRALFLRKPFQDDFYPPRQKDSKSSRATGTLLLDMDDGRRLRAAIDGRKNLIEDVDKPWLTAVKENFLPLSGYVFDRVFVF